MQYRCTGFNSGCVGLIDNSKPVGRPMNFPVSANAPSVSLSLLPPPPLGKRVFAYSIIVKPCRNFSRPAYADPLSRDEHMSDICILWNKTIVNALTYNLALCYVQCALSAMLHFFPSPFLSIYPTRLSLLFRVRIFAFAQNRSFARSLNSEPHASHNPWSGFSLTTFKRAMN